MQKSWRWNRFVDDQTRVIRFDSCQSASFASGRDAGTFRTNTWSVRIGTATDGTFKVRPRCPFIHSTIFFNISFSSSTCSPSLKQCCHCQRVSRGLQVRALRDSCLNRANIYIQTRCIVLHAGPISRAVSCQRRRTKAAGTVYRQRFAAPHHGKNKSPLLSLIPTRLSFRARVQRRRTRRTSRQRS